MNDAWLALIGAIFGGAGLKVVDHWLTKSKEKDDAQAKFREELREEVKRLREDLRKSEADVDIWQEKYYALLVAERESFRAEANDMGMKP